jgi:hypothetical protein
LVERKNEVASLKCLSNFLAPPRARNHSQILLSPFFFHPAKPAIVSVSTAAIGFSQDFTVIYTHEVGSMGLSPLLATPPTQREREEGILSTLPHAARHTPLSMKITGIGLMQSVAPTHPCPPSLHQTDPSADVSVSYATLVAPSSTTHSTNFNQRVVKLLVRAGWARRGRTAALMV